MLVGWLLFGVSAVLAAAAVVLAVAGLSSPPFLLAAGAVAVGSYGAWSGARQRLVEGVYDRVDVEPNADGTVGDEGANAERTATGRVAFEPRDDWDDPEDWPFDDPFWTDEDVEQPRWVDGDGTGGTADAERHSRRGDRDPVGDGAAESTGTATGTATAGASDASGDGRAVGGNLRTVAPRTREACDVLGVDLDASAEELRTAYRDGVKATHPDHGGDEASFRRVRWAYEYLRARRE